MAGGFTDIEQIGSPEEKERAKILKPKQYTFSDHNDEYPTLVVKDEAGRVSISRATSREPNKNEDIILKQLKPDGYTGVEIVGPNSHLR